LGEYFWSPLGDEVCCLVVEMSMVLYFQNVLGCVYGFTACRVCVFLVCRSASFSCASPDACVGGNCFVVGVFDCWEVFLVNVLVPCFVEDV